MSFVLHKRENHIDIPCLGAPVSMSKDEAYLINSLFGCCVVQTRFEGLYSFAAYPVTLDFHRYVKAAVSAC